LTARLSAPPPNVGFSSLAEAVASGGGRRILAAPGGAAEEALRSAVNGEPEAAAREASRGAPQPRSLAEAVQLVQHNRKFALYADVYLIAAL